MKSPDIKLSRELIAPFEVSWGVLLYGLEESRMKARTLVETTLQHKLNPGDFKYALLNNTGDFMPAFIACVATDLIVGDLCGVGSQRWRMGISTAVGTSLVIAAETVNGLFGSVADLADIPAGLLGVGAYLGMKFITPKIAGVVYRRLGEGKILNLAGSTY